MLTRAGWTEITKLPSRRDLPIFLLPASVSCDPECCWTQLALWGENNQVMAVVKHKESIHSGHFMVSDFEADDNIGDEADLEVIESLNKDQTRWGNVSVPGYIKLTGQFRCVQKKYWEECSDKKIDDSLVKLSGCMSSGALLYIGRPSLNIFHSQCTNRSWPLPSGTDFSD